MNRSKYTPIFETATRYYDAEPVTLATRVLRAANNFHHYHPDIEPDLCLVHPSMLAVAPNADHEAGGVTVRARLTVDPNTFWIGKAAQP